MLGEIKVLAEEEMLKERIETVKQMWERSWYDGVKAVIGNSSIMLWCERP